MKRIILTVTTDLNHDQRMLRIAGSLYKAGYAVTLLGREKPASQPLSHTPFLAKRMKLRCHKGPFFYAEFNIRLFLTLLFSKSDIISAADLDSLPGAWLAARLRGKILVFDAHELYTEVPELIHRPVIRKIWLRLEQFLVSKLKYAYTVNQSLADWYFNRYGIRFEVIRNMPLAQAVPDTNVSAGYLLYQGALNAGRGLEMLLEAVKITGIPCVIAGGGDLETLLHKQVSRADLGDLVRFTGPLKAAELTTYTQKAWLGVNLLEAWSPNYYYSLANKFFDYVQAAVPQLSMDFPEYQRLNAVHEVAVLLPELQLNTLVSAIESLKNDTSKYAALQQNCRKASAAWIWEKEEETLIRFYKLL